MPLTKVSSGVIAANAVVDSFGTQSITGDKIGLGAITGNTLASNIINANNIVNASITGAKLAANTVSGDVIGQNAISSNNIVSVNASIATVGTLPKARLPAGSVLQVVHANNTSSINVNGSNVEVQSVSITPSSVSSRILVAFSSGNVDNASNGGEVYMYLKRGGSTGTVLLMHPTTTGYYSAPGRIIVPVSFTCLDSPATTSATTYGMYCSTASSPSPAVNGAQLTLMEIAG